MYSCMRLICTSNSAFGSTLISMRSAITSARCSLLSCLAAAQRAWKSRSSANASKLRQLRGVVEEALAQRLHQQLGQMRIGLVKPAAEGDAIGLVADAVGEDLVQVAEHGLLDQFRMQRRHAVDLVRAEEGQMAHAHMAAAVLVDQRHGASSLPASSRPLARRPSRCLALIRIDDLHVARQQPLHQRHRPGLQRLRQQRVVGVGEGGDGDLPGARPRSRHGHRPAGASVRRRRSPDGCR